METKETTNMETRVPEGPRAAPRPCTVLILFFCRLTVLQTLLIKRLPVGVLLLTSERTVVHLDLNIKHHREHFLPETWHLP